MKLSTNGYTLATPKDSIRGRLRCEPSLSVMRGERAFSGGGFGGRRLERQMYQRKRTKSLQITAVSQRTGWTAQILPSQSFSKACSACLQHHPSQFRRFELR